MRMCRENQLVRNDLQVHPRQSSQKYTFHSGLDVVLKSTPFIVA